MEPMTLRFTSSFVAKRSHLLLQTPLLHLRPQSTFFSIKSEQNFPPSSSFDPPKPTIPTQPSDDDTSSTRAPPPQKPNSAGLGFGSSSSKSTPSPVTSKNLQRGNKESASVIRREPLQKPDFASQRKEIQPQEQSRNESAFLLAWLGLGVIILVQGILLAASGFLPEEWDDFFVKYLYPSFTPTVFLFVAGSVAYGVLKYLQTEKFNDQK